MKNNNYKVLLSLIPLSFMLVACGSTPEQQPVQQTLPDDVPYQVTEDYNSGVISYTVQRGDRLSDIALEFTGQTSTWRDIAQYNNISDPRRLREGMILEIPTDMIPGYERPTPPIQPQARQSIPVAQSSSLAVRTEQPAEVAPVVVTPINTNRNFDLNPIDASSTNQSNSFAGAGAQIKVVGTLFVLDSQVNEWYKIQTSTGSGYIRTNDAAIIK